MSRVASLKLSFNPVAVDHTSCRLFLNIVNTTALRGAFPTAKIECVVDDDIEKPELTVEYTNGTKLSMQTNQMTVEDIKERVRNGIRRVINQEQ